MKTLLNLRITIVLVSLSNAVSVINATLVKNLYEGILEMSILKRAKVNLRSEDRGTLVPYVEWFLNKVICLDYT